MNYTFNVLAIGLLAAGQRLSADSSNTYEMASHLVALRTSVAMAGDVAALTNILQADIRVRTQAACARETAAFEAIRTRADWESFRNERLDAMRKSFGSGDALPVPVGGPAYEVTGTVEGDGFRVENLVIAGRPGLPITANLYVPAKPATNMPGILVVTSHHNPKWQGELQEMGMTWARSGCLVLIIDNLGYGERSQQFFGGREDYRWRYYLGMQLHTVGESLMAWMVADLRRGLDVLTSRPGVDPERILVIGSVAGGGDLAGVLGATDSRVTCAISYNYGSAGIQQPVAPDKTAWANTIGGGDFDAVRCLRNKGRDGFNNWMIVASIAPRHTIFAHEFDWQPAGDEGFARITRVFELYSARDHLGTAQGGTDCNNVDAAHRRKFYPTLERWLNLPPPEEYRKRMSVEQLTCLTPAARPHWPAQPVHALLADQGARQIASARAALAALPAEQRKAKLRRDWAAKLGNVIPAGVPEVRHSESVSGEGYVAERLLLAVEPAILVPAVLLKPAVLAGKAGAKQPVVIAVAQGGKDLFLARRALETAELLSCGVAVCLVDVRGTGESLPVGDRLWYSDAVDYASRDLMLGQTILGSRVRDLRSVLRYLQSRPDLDGRRVAVWGESFASVNPPKFVDPPMKSDNSALQAEPMGATAALLLALYEDDVKAVVARGGLTGYAALLDGPACHVVLDAIVPDVLEAGDLTDVVAMLVPRPVRLEGSVDGRNRLAGQDRLEKDYAPARATYHACPAALTLTPGEADDVAAWLNSALAN